MQEQTGTSRELPRYRSHKEVGALKIQAIEVHGEDGATITAENQDYRPFRVSAAWYERHQPRVGGYYVRYEDGYESFSPAAAFEEGYTKVSTTS